MNYFGKENSAEAATRFSENFSDIFTDFFRIKMMTVFQDEYLDNFKKPFVQMVVASTLEGEVEVFTRDFATNYILDLLNGKSVGEGAKKFLSQESFFGLNIYATEPHVLSASCFAEAFAKDFATAFVKSFECENLKSKIELCVENFVEGYIYGFIFGRRDSVQKK